MDVQKLSSATPNTTLVGTGSISDTSDSQVFEQILLNEIDQLVQESGMESVVEQAIDGESLSDSVTSPMSNLMSLAESNPSIPLLLSDPPFLSTFTGGGATSAGVAGATPEGLPAESSSMPIASTLSTPTNIATAIAQASQQYGVPANLIRAVIQQESGMNTHSVSSVGAMGLMQLMPSTAQSLGVLNPFDPVQNIMGGTKYLSQLLNQFGGNETLAVAAYNAGPGAVQKYDGVPPYSETQSYVQKVLGYANQFADL